MATPLNKTKYRKVKPVFSLCRVLCHQRTEPASTHRAAQSPGPLSYSPTSPTSHVQLLATKALNTSPLLDSLCFSLLLSPDQPCLGPSRCSPDEQADSSCTAVFLKRLFKICVSSRGPHFSPWHTRAVAIRPWIAFTTSLFLLMLHY